ncbi:MAG TPA: ketopantoate reductase C-terminal domain-containing protein [Acidimicrobiia bacterium]|nr:ketopantoate reductase C-terminal domain-containing protein [Acidimicrobiia bacterium]
MPILNDQGLRVESAMYGNFAVAADAVSVLTAPVDVCVVAVKAMQLEAAMERVPEHALGEAVVVPFLNGVDHVDVLRRLYGAAVVPGTLRVASTRTAPGRIRHSSPFVRVELAVSDTLDGQRRETVVRFERRLVAAGVEVDIRDDELSMLWGKLIFLCPLALLTTLYGIAAGEARTARRDELVAVINEVAEVGQAVGAKLSAESALEFFDSVPPTMQSSMQHDAAAGKALELDAIGGAVLRASDRTGIPVPVTRRLVAGLMATTPGWR